MTEILQTATVWIFSSKFPALAYIDPGTGTIVLQLIIGGIAGAGLLLKYYYRQIGETFARWHGKADNAENASDSE